MNRLTESLSKAKQVWQDKHAKVEYKLTQGLSRFWKALDRIACNIGKLILMGIILNVISAYFYPEFPERFPAIYGWFDGWLQLGEFAYKAVLGGVYALFTGNSTEFWLEYTKAIGELMQQFANWLSQIHF